MINFKNCFIEEAIIPQNVTIVNNSLFNAFYGLNSLM